MNLLDRLTVRSEDLSDSLHGVLDRLPANTPIIVHSDLLRTGILDGLSDSEQLCEAYLALLRGAAGNRPLLIPTFNYDYCQTRVYDIARAPGQVGRLSRHCTNCYPSRRTLTPVFNFCIFNDDDIGGEPARNPFGAGSVFDRFYCRNGAVLFLGTSMIANTFVHFVEERLDVAYRYLKPFPGVIRRGDSECPIAFIYRVRPRAPVVLKYGDLGEHALTAANRLIRFRLGLSHSMMFRSQDYLEVISSKMETDPLYLLDSRCRAGMEALLGQHGGRLNYEEMEASRKT